MASNVNEFGQVLRANMGEDVSTNIGLEFILEPEAGTKLTKTQSDGVVVGTVAVTEGDKSLAANQYLEYTVKDGDLDQSGRWRKKGIAKISTTNEKVGNYERFTVLP